MIATAAPAAAACFDFNANGHEPRAITTRDPLDTAAIGEHPSIGKASVGESWPLLRPLLLSLLLLLLLLLLLYASSSSAPSNSDGDTSCGPKIAWAVCQNDEAGAVDEDASLDSAGAAV